MADTTDPMRDVREGMRVVDADGTVIGKVEDFKMGDPAVTTTAGESAIAPEDFVDVYGRQDQISPQLARRLLRIGFVEIDRKGFLRHNELVAADQLDRVDDGSLVLKPSYQAATT